MKKFNSKKSGFTLIELIVVIAIIGILIAITVPRLATYIQTAQVTSERAGAKTVYTAAVAYNTTQNAPTTGDISATVLQPFVDANAEIVPPAEVKARGQYGVNVGTDGTYTVTYWDVSANNGAGAAATMVDGAIDTTTAS